MRLSDLKERLSEIFELEDKEELDEDLAELLTEVEGQLVRGGDREIW